jgi:hypothetical protein
MFQKIGSKEHEETLCHKGKLLVVENEKIHLQKATKEINKHPIGRPRLQTQLAYELRK